GSEILSRFLGSFAACRIQGGTGDHIGLIGSIADRWRSSSRNQDRSMAFPTDLPIAQNARLQPIAALAEKLGVAEEKLEYFGRHKAKLPLDLIDEARVERSKLVLVPAVAPTPGGEGKTTMSTGLCECLNNSGTK